MGIPRSHGAASRPRQRNSPRSNGIAGRGQPPLAKRPRHQVFATLICFSMLDFFEHPYSLAPPAPLLPHPPSVSEDADVFYPESE